MADIVTLQAQLAAATVAYNAVMTGNQEIMVEHGDMRVTYTKANAGALKSYIDDLRAQIVSLGGADTGLRRRAIVIDL
jgi:hypothetical protein